MRNNNRRQRSFCPLFAKEYKFSIHENVMALGLVTLSETEHYLKENMACSFGPSEIYVI